VDKLKRNSIVFSKFTTDQWPAEGTGVQTERRPRHPRQGGIQITFYENAIVDASSDCKDININCMDLNETCLRGACKSKLKDARER